MSSIKTHWELLFKDKVSPQVGEMTDKLDTAVKKTNVLGDCFKRLSAIDLYAISNSIQNLNNQFQQVNAPFISFESGLAEVSAITGVVGKGLEDLGAKARASALDFGGTATDSLNTYKTILSRLGPDIAKSPEALEKMERNVRVLSKTMGGDAVASVDALTTAMLQYGVDLSNPIQAQAEMERMMNIMAAGAKEGAAEVPSIAQALKVAGVQAKQSNVSFAETNAALQELAKGGKEGSEAGTALRNVLGKMAGEDVLPQAAAEKLRALGVDMSIVSDTTLPLTSRLRELKKAQGDATMLAQMFGVENAAAASILLNSVDAQDELTQKIQGTNTAFEQAETIMDTQAEKQSRFKALIEDIKISIGEYTSGLSTSFSMMTTGLSVMADAQNAYKGYKMAIGGVNVMLGLNQKASLMTTLKALTMAGATKVAAAAQWAWNAAMRANPIGLILTGLTALVGVIALCWNKFEGFRTVVFKAWEMIKLFGGAIKDYVIERLKGMLSGITGIGKALMHFFKGDWKKAWETGVKATDDLLGVSAGVKMVNTVKEGVPKALAAGAKSSSEYTEKTKEKEAKPTSKTLDADINELIQQPTGTAPKNLGTKENKAGKKEDGLQVGSGSGGIKSVTMTLNVTNHFSVNKDSNMRQVADAIIGPLNDRLRDAVINLG